MVNAYMPAGLEEALLLLNTREMIIMAGGTDLMVKFRAKAGTMPSFKKDVLLIGQIDELRGIAIEGGFLKIGSAASMSDVLKSKYVPDYVKEPLRQIGSPAIRNMGTLGGNICNSSPAADSLTMLYALDATLDIVSADASRNCGIEDFIVGPRKNSLLPNEVVKSISIPLKPFNRFFYRKAGQRRANAIAKVSFYGLADANDGRLSDIRMALGAVAPVIVRSRNAEAFLCSSAPSDYKEKAAFAAKELLRAVVPIDDVRSNKEYRRKVAENLIARFLEEVKPRE